MCKPVYFLPDYVRDQSPQQAWSIECLRRKLIDFYRCYGYRYVDPPIIEYADALTSGASSDLRDNLVTLENDGQQLALRIDFTPQVARVDAMDAKDGDIQRYCYAGTIVMRKPRNTKGTRNPMQIGAECIGNAHPHSDNEIVSILLLSLDEIALPSVLLRLNDLRIVRRLCELGGINFTHDNTATNSGMSVADGNSYLYWLERRSFNQTRPWLEKHCTNAQVIELLSDLPSMFGDLSMTQSPRWHRLADFDEQINTYMTRLVTLAANVGHLQTDIVFDLADVRGYSYHNALTFALYSDGLLIGQGGRYDNIGSYFGKSRPAIGFSLDMELLSQQLASTTPQCIWIPFHLVSRTRQLVASMRSRNIAVIEAQTEDQQVPCYCTDRAVIDDSQDDGIAICRLG